MVRAGSCALALLAVLAAACGDDATTTPDADVVGGDARVDDIDAANDVSALEVEWRLDPKLDDEPTGPLQLVVTDVKLALADVRAIGDAAVLSRESFELDFSHGEWPVLRWSPAAPGLYASVVGQVKTYELRGTIDLDGTGCSFEITDEPPPSMTFAFALRDAEVRAGKTLRVEAELRVRAVIEEIDWSQVEDEGGVLEIDHEWDGIDELREELADAFRPR